MKKDLFQVPAASTSKRRPDAKLLIINRQEASIEITTLNKLPSYLKSEDMIVANDAGTLPASFSGKHLASGKPIEIRLAEGHGGFSKIVNNGLPKTWTAILLGDGDWRKKSEDRTSTPLVSKGDILEFGGSLKAKISEVDSKNHRWIRIHFLTSDHQLWSKFFAAARPIQYFYHQKKLELWDIQTAFANRPIALEAPSSALHFDSALIESLKANGKLITISHGTGISETGEASLNKRLPLPEAYHISKASCVAIQEHLRHARGRTIAIGTGVARALESWDQNSGWGETNLKINGDHQLRKVNSILTGMHEPDSSHWQLLKAFAPEPLLYEAFHRAREEGFLWHEFGDLMWIY